MEYLAVSSGFLAVGMIGYAYLMRNKTNTLIKKCDSNCKCQDLDA